MSRGTSFVSVGRSAKGLTLVWIALFVFSLLLQSVTLAAPSSALAASGLLADTVQGFEVDGDLKSGDAATTPATCPAATSGPVCIPEALVHNPPMANGDDWLQGASHNGVASASGTSTPTTFLYEDATDPGDDSAYGGGNKEDDTRDWVYVNNAGPNPKTDFKHIMAHARPNAAGDSAIAYLGAERIVNNGTMVVDFELNQKAFKQFSVGPAKPNRTNGDLLISLEYSNGGGNPVVTLYTITNVQTFASGQTNDFTKVSDAKTIAAVHSATNFVDLTSSGFGYTVPSFDFAEASVDLKALGIENACPGFSSGHIRSRTGGSPETSQLKDAAPQFPIDLNNCGKVTIVKNAVPNDAQDFDFTGAGGTPLTGTFSLDNDGNNGNTLSNTKTFNLVPPGTDYLMTEATTAGWKLTDITCDDNDSPTSLANRRAAIHVGPNEHVTCTFTNTKLGKVILEKQTSPDGAAGDFVFTSDLAGLGATLQDNGTSIVENVEPGVYHATEADPTPPFDLGSIVCEDSKGNDSSGDVPSRVATFHVEAGETVKCTFTNVKRGTITIIKDANPNSAQNFAYTTTGSGLSNFTLDDDAEPTLSNTQTFTNIKPGSYSVTESDVASWELTGLTCTGTNGSTGVKSGATANIDLKAGGSVTCTYVNTKAGNIIVDKITDPSGDPASFEFDPSWGANFSLTDQGAPVDSGDLKFGKYSVAELAKAGWDLTNAECTGGNTPDEIDLQPGETVTCTFTNTKRGHILVDKVTVPGGDPQEFTFTPSYNGGQTFKLTDASPKNDSGALVHGTYSVSEAGVTDWNQTSATCNDGSPVTAISLQAGETVTCTFTNTKRGVIIIDKQTLPAGDSQQFTFTASYNGGATFQLADATAPNNSGGQDPGTYSVSEGAVAGWDLTSATCDDQSPVNAISLQAGEVVTCTFINTKRGHILIDKVTNPSGDLASFEFDSNYGANFFLTDTSAANDSGAIVPGTYSVAELAKTGWDLKSAVCSDQSPVTAISLQPGETITCTFTNTKRGTIIVEKQTSPDGASGDFTFAGDAAGSISDGEQIVVNNLKPGTYTSTEADPGANFDLGAIVCDDAQSPTHSSGDVATAKATFKLDPGETVTCVFTNVQRGTITIIKDAQPDSSQDFAYTTSGSGLSGFSLDDDNDSTLSNTKVFQNLVAGSYPVTEGTVAGWDLTSITCNPLGGSTATPNGATANLTLAEGGSITCVYVNSKPSISIIKTAGNAADGTEFVTAPGPVTYHYHVTNTGPVSLKNIVVTDDNGTPADSGDDFTATCPKTTLAAGESMDCSATVTVNSNRTNIGTANGTSNGGTEVEDSDDAVVRVPTVNIDKSADDHLVEPNQVVTFTINVEVVNGPVHNAIVTDTLPVGQTYVAGSASPSEPTVSANGRTLTWNLGTLNNGDPAVTITYDVKIDGNATTDPQKNVAKICVSDLPNCGTDDETVTPEKPGIEIVKTAGDAADGEVYTTEPGNVTYAYVVHNTGPLPLQNVTVNDDNGTPVAGDDFAVTCPKTTLAVGESMTCTATILVSVDKTNVATARGFTVEGNPVQDDDDAVVQILTHGLVISKSNNAPIETLELPDGTTADLPTAPEGSTVTFTLHYTFSGDPVTHGVITDVLPLGLTYVNGSATNNAEFTFVAYSSTTRTLTWTAAKVIASGTVTYQAKVDVGAAARPQPLVNVATISSDQTPPDDDKSEVFVPVIPKGETNIPTPPPTDLAPSQPSNPGPGMGLLLAVLGLLVVGVGFVTPAPAVIRRRNRR